ncbi:Tetratricopeptide repeat-containing protein [Malonomonas rubra DSM 5091]|uniref:Tetratricopeptide repeat-containing protein n=1 Tax=Malonomonas rubra DSM 5091 TaxID=1122189 RepID=A0A1M6JTK7_MALRU|nr:Tetratricopeptide repeat-containing protein [Malonomonas rubra DSM 5091]
MKKQLKIKQRQTARKNKASRWILPVLLLLLIAAAAVPVYQQLQKTAPERLFDKALELESRGKIDAAQEKFRSIFTSYPQSDLAPVALLRSGKIWHYDKRQEQRALLEYLQLEHDYSGHSEVREAQLSAAKIIKHSLRDYSRAIGFYQRLLDQSTVDRDQLYYEIADCYFRLDNYSQARIELETLLEEYPQTSLLADVLYRKGSLLLLENKLEAARQDWQQLIEQFPENKQSIQARFNLAQLLEEGERLQEALKMYQELQDFPRPALLQEKIEHLKKRIAAKKKAI